MSKQDELLEYLRGRFGASNNKSQEGVIEAHGSIDNMKLFVAVWANHHGVHAISLVELFTAYASAVDLGYRMGLKAREVQS